MLIRQFVLIITIYIIKSQFIHLISHFELCPRAITFCEREKKTEISQIFSQQKRNSRDDGKQVTLPWRRSPRAAGFPPPLNTYDLDTQRRTTPAYYDLEGEQRNLL